MADRRKPGKPSFDRRWGQQNSASPFPDITEHVPFDGEDIEPSLPDLTHGGSSAHGFDYGHGYDMTPSTAVNPNALYTSLPESMDNKYWVKQDVDKEEHIADHGGSGGLFERPEWKRLAVHSLACACAYPLTLLICLLANHKSIWWARFIVGFGSGILGVVFSISLLEFAKRHLEASTWATIIHKSNCDDVWTAVPGITLNDLAMYTRERTSIYSAVRLLADRNMFKGGTDRKLRQSYDKRPWSVFILFYLFLVCFCSAIPFIFGRIIIINPITVQQGDTFDETFVWGDLSESDVNASVVLSSTLQQSSEWTLVPFASLTDYPPSVAFSYESNTLYFVDAYEEQLHQDGTGLGTFQLNGTLVDVRGTRASQSLTESTTAESEYVQFPRWGIRIYCDLLPDPGTYMVPMSLDSFTYVFVPDLFLSELFGNLSLPYPDLPQANLTSILSQNDSASVLSGVNPEHIPVAGKFFNNGVTHSFFSNPVTQGASGSGWLQVEVLLIRINMTYAPNGSFPLRGAEMPDVNNNPTFVGYDAAVCVEAYEPWIVETYNATGLAPSLTRVVGNGSLIPDTNTGSSGGKRRHGLPAEKIDVQRTINSTGKFNPFAIAHDNSVNQMLKDNGRDFWYQPSPLAVSFTDGAGPSGYTKLSPARYAQARAQADATNVLPFLAGTGAIVARVYPSRTVSSTEVDTLPMIIINISLFFIGLIACLCIPRLPLGVPRRGFDLLTWLTVLHEDNIIGQLPPLPSGRSYDPATKSTVDNIGSKIGDVRVKYKV